VGWTARSVITFAVIAAFAPTGAARHQNPQDPPAFKGGSSDVVVVPVTVTDKDGRLISDLQRDAFAVYDNDRRQEIAFFAHEDTPVSVALVIDSSGSMRPKVGEVIAATLAFARASHPEDELLVIEFNERVRRARWPPTERRRRRGARDHTARAAARRPDGSV